MYNRLAALCHSGTPILNILALVQLTATGSIFGYPLLLKSCPITLALFLYANHLKNGPIILKQC